MVKGEVGVAISAAMVGLFGTPTLLVMAGWAAETNPLLALVARLTIFAFIPAVTARVGFGWGLAAGRRQPRRTTPPNETSQP